MRMFGVYFNIKQNQMKNNIKETMTFKLVSEEARELSVKLQNHIYVIQLGNTLYCTTDKQNDLVICEYYLGNLVE